MIAAIAAISVTLFLIPYTFSLFRTCVPNTHFQLNDRVCYCDHTGRWNDANCNIGARRDVSKSHSVTQFEKDGQCTPFRSYYVNCHLCSCPASGLTNEARCVPDTPCIAKGPMPSDLRILLNTVCIPNVMYLFLCMSCMCSEKGHFIMNKCTDTCKPNRQHNVSCIPGTLYKQGCNVCKCPSKGAFDANLCTKVDCKHESRRSLEILRSHKMICSPNKFTKPKCIYCECGTNGKVNKEACYELDCIRDSSIRYDLEHNICTPNTVVPFCIECFCLYNGLIDHKYCTKSCSFQSKLLILENVLKENIVYVKNNITKVNKENTCEPHSLFMDNDRYCSCPDNGDANSAHCTSLRNHKTNVSDISEKKRILMYNTPCAPNTFVDLECNTCYCNKSGQIDAKWCTNDDCDAKKYIQQKNRAQTTIQNTTKCTPGTISKSGCNFCVCPDNGSFKERICTNTECHKDIAEKIDDKLYCDPLEYYIVDCNVCYCPEDGVKNIEKCTKKVCEKNFLRSNLCEPGLLFGNDCNICVCPENGDKNGGVCTNHTCSEANAPWNKIFKLTQDLLNTNGLEEKEGNIDLCFPGELFTNDCKICICPDMGLRSFAACTPYSCENEQDKPTSEKEYDDMENTDEYRRHSKDGETCTNVSLTDSPKKECTPGSVYIIRCRQCICPMMGDINMFCRPMPKGVYCEQAYPYYNYIPPGRRTEKDDSTLQSINIPQGKDHHNHTSHDCHKSGYIMDECFVCECKSNIIVEEHCFKNDDVKCVDAKPTFLDRNFVSSL